MKKMRKGIVVLVVSAAAAAGAIGSGAGAQASRVPSESPVVKVVTKGGQTGGGFATPLRGSSWQ